MTSVISTALNKNSIGGHVFFSHVCGLRWKHEEFCGHNFYLATASAQIVLAPQFDSRGAQNALALVGDLLQRHKQTTKRCANFALKYRSSRKVPSTATMSHATTATIELLGPVPWINVTKLWITIHILANIQTLHFPMLPMGLFWKHIKKSIFNAENAAYATRWVLRAHHRSHMLDVGHNIIHLGREGWPGTRSSAYVVCCYLLAYLVRRDWSPTRKLTCNSLRFI